MTRELVQGLVRFRILVQVWVLAELQFSDERIARNRQNRIEPDSTS
jgi:hypothetical protein